MKNSNDAPDSSNTSMSGGTADLSPNRYWAELNRRNPDDPYAWAMRHRRIGGNPLTHIPALVDIARDDFRFVVIQKSAQIGITEVLVNLALWAADTAYAERGNVLYAMPTQNQMDDFTQSRFDRALQNSPYLRGRLQPEPPRRKGADRLRLKHLGDGYIYMRGSESKGQIASVDADLVVLDEFDQMADGILDLSLKRLASSRAGLIRVASTPRFAETGINELFLQSDQRRYYLACRGCDLEQPLTFVQNVDCERALLVCRSCGVPMDVKASGKWVAEAPGNDRIHGYHLSRLYSPWLDIAALIEPPRECWRLQSLRGWSDDTTRQIPSRDPRAGGADGVRARAGPLVAVGNDQLDRLEVRDDAGDVTEVGAAG